MSEFVSSDVQACRRCCRCKEVLGLECFGRGMYWCRPCEALRAREYRRTSQYRAAYEAWKSQPEVQERRRNSWKKRPRDRGGWSRTVRARLMNMRATYQYRAKKYRREGKIDLSRLQIDKAAAITEELKRLERKATR